MCDLKAAAIYAYEQLRTGYVLLIKHPLYPENGEFIKFDLKYS